MAVNLEGEKTFLRRIEVPAAAQRQLTEVLPYELESELPFELSEAVYDYAVLKRASDAEAIPVFAVVARTEDVRERIDLVKNAIGEEPERVSPGGLSLSSLRGDLARARRPANGGPVRSRAGALGARHSRTRRAGVCSHALAGHRGTSRGRRPCWFGSFANRWRRGA